MINRPNPTKQNEETPINKKINQCHKRLTHTILFTLSSPLLLQRRWRWRGGRRIIAIIIVVIATATPIPGLQAEDHDENNNQQQNNGEASPLAGVLLGGPGLGELLCATADEGVGSHDVVFDVVDLLPLRLHQHRHVQEHLVQLLQVPLHVLYGIVSLLDLLNRVKDLAPPLLLYCLLQKRFALSCRFNSQFG